MTLTAFYFYQALYVLFSSLNHFSSCQRENKNKWREQNTPRPISPSLHMATPISNLLSIQPSLYDGCCCVSFSHNNLSFTWSHSYWFLSTFPLLSGKMSYETQIPLLKVDVQHCAYWGFDKSITVVTAPHVFWQDWWSQLTVVMTGPCNSWLMDTSLCPAELITAENAQQAAALFSCVNFVISACLTIPDQYSIKEGFFCLRLICCFSVRKPRKTEQRTTCCRLKNKTGLLQKMREEDNGSSRRRYSVTVYSTASLKHSGTR